jgi:hypothetical protein
MAKPARGKSLQDVLRARREATSLLSVRELQEREAAREREQDAQQATELVARWRDEGRLVDGKGKLSPSVYRAVFALDRAAYFESMRWARLAKAQTAETPRCEVARCHEEDDLHAHLVTAKAAGEERPADLMTLCAGCLRRVGRRAQERKRPLTRDEVITLDPEQPLYDRAAIAALRKRYSRPLKQSDLER